ncbi:MAG: FlgD immunoglobulin-like domain containing protein, partial [Candidatus Latescibacterota bacterium]
LDTVTGVDMPIYSSPFDIGTLDWSPDGNSIAYAVINPYNYNDRYNREIYTDTFRGHTTEPYVRLISPVAGNRYIGAINVEFLAFNTGSLTFEFSADGGSTWQVVGMGVNPEDRHFSFNVSGIFSPQCQLRMYDENHPETVDSFAPGWYFGCGVAPPEYGNQLTNDNGSHWFVDWSPDGKYVTYVFRSDIWVSPVDGGEDINLTANYGNNVIFPTFTPDSKAVTFSKYSGNSSNIVSVNLETMQESILIENGTNSCWSHNGRYIAYRVRSTSELAILDTVTHQVSIIAPSDGGTYGVVSFTHDDANVITTMNVGGQQHLFLIPINGGQPIQLTDHVGKQWYPDSSSDGEWIIYTNFTSNNSAGRELWAYNTYTKTSEKIFPELINTAWCSSFSPDGSKFAYILDYNFFTGMQSGGTNDIYIANFPFITSPTDLLLALLDDIESLVSNGILTENDAQPLVAKLQAAIAKLDGMLGKAVVPASNQVKGNSGKNNPGHTAINILNAFINQVEAWSGKKLTQKQADELISFARHIISSIEEERGVGKIAADETVQEEPVPYQLGQNSPNPFNPSTAIEYQIASGSSDRVTLKVYDLRGAVVKTLVDRVESPGMHSVIWNGRDDSGNIASSGIYIYQIKAGNFVQSNKMTLMR